MTFAIRKGINTVDSNIGQNADFRIEQSADGSGRYVEVVALDAGGSIDIGQVDQGNAGTQPWLVSGSKTVSITVIPTVTASNAYGANYIVGGLLTFSNAFTSTGSGILQNVIVNINNVETNGFTFVPFNANPSSTTWTDAAVANINSADVSKVRGPISLAAYSGLGTHTVAYAYGLGEAFAPGSTTLYGVLIANAALTNNFTSASDVTVTINVLQDV